MPKPFDFPSLIVEKLVDQDGYSFPNNVEPNMTSKLLLQTLAPRKSGW